MSLGQHTITFTTQELIEVREAIAFTCRERKMTKAKRKRLIEVAEHKLLRAMIGEPQL